VFPYVTHTTLRHKNDGNCAKFAEIHETVFIILQHHEAKNNAPDLMNKIIM
jgi:hypothetical protein